MTLSSTLDGRLSFRSCVIVSQSTICACLLALFIMMVMFVSRVFPGLGFQIVSQSAHDFACWRVRTSTV